MVYICGFSTVRFDFSKHYTFLHFKLAGVCEVGIYSPHCPHHSIILSTPHEAPSSTDPSVRPSTILYRRRRRRRLSLPPRQLSRGTKEILWRRRKHLSRSRRGGQSLCVRLDIEIAGQVRLLLTYRSIANHTRTFDVHVSMFKKRRCWLETPKYNPESFLGGDGGGWGVR